MPTELDNIMDLFVIAAGDGANEIDGLKDYLGDITNIHYKSCSIKDYGVQEDHPTEFYADSGKPASQRNWDELWRNRPRGDSDSTGPPLYVTGDGRRSDVGQPGPMSYDRSAPVGPCINFVTAHFKVSVRTQFQ